MKYDSSHIAQLQEEIAQNSLHAFESLYKILYPGLHRFSMSYVGHHEIAEEIVNDIMLKLWLRRAEITSINNLPAYLFTATRNASITSQLSRRYMEVVAEGEGLPARLISTATPQEQMEWKDELNKFQLVVDRFPEHLRQVFKLVKEEGFPVKEAAEILGISPRTVETQLYRAFKKLNAALPGLRQHFSRKN